MSDLGALLRKAREERGLSLEDVQESTKIRKRYLEAIENGDHSILPGTFYLRAFVKNYCEAVGLDADEVLRLYQHEVPASVTDQIVEKPAAARAPRRVQTQSSERISKLGFNVLMWSFLILIVVVVWVYFVNQQGNDTKEIDQTNITDEASQAPSPTTDSSNGAGTNSPSATPSPTPSEPTSVTFTAKKGKVDHYDVAPAGTVHKLEIKISGGKVWMEVRKGSDKGEQLMSGNVEDGQVISYDITEPLYVNVGRADLSVISVDGITVNDGDQARSKKVLLNPVQGAGAGADANASPTPSASADTTAQ
ncbi:RodZ domain-containing protein [Paenibacillus sp. NEAU-GSW1]|uniref:RodZ domain-containing protein n=1 Tax=Paenibacillus sp. NEAU-GSW1 TaxID=2682486 RepID=UPI0012E1C546|nr:RodZ domain-containing protein [Paenibacillus sp. NEAU-GSW1]MUT66421.1 helix-turn-helix domain-containing protein [Paenibacillus sp. NEAU-GSW1]